MTKKTKAKPKGKPKTSGKSQDTPPQESTAQRARTWEKAFLQTLSRTGNVTVTCQAVGIDRKTAYNYRNTNEDFAEAWLEAIESFSDLLEQAALNRGVVGVEEPVFYKGVVVGSIRKFSDRLLERLLEAHKPEKYAKRTVTLTEDDIDRALREAEDELARRRSLRASSSKAPKAPAAKG